MKISKEELMHQRLQAWLRENQCEEFEYPAWQWQSLNHFRI